MDIIQVSMLENESQIDAITGYRGVPFRAGGSMTK
jgi:hypothetical protein